MLPKTLVIQSHRQPPPACWYQPCLASVRQWAQANAYDYRFLNDALFDLLPADLREKTRSQPVIAADLGRLLALQDALREGWDRVVWFDADTLVIAPERLCLPDSDYAFGREVWIQQAAAVSAGNATARSAPLRVYKKIHNAFMCFTSTNPVLDFYLHAAQRLVLAHEGAMAPQFIGPKFLATLHNLLRFPVLEEAAVLCPLVAEELLAQAAGVDSTRTETDALRLFRQHSEAPAALNLCGSMVQAGELTDSQMGALIDLLLAQPRLLRAN